MNFLKRGQLPARQTKVARDDRTRDRSLLSFFKRIGQRNDSTPAKADSGRGVDEVLLDVGVAEDLEGGAEADPVALMPSPIVEQRTTVTVTACGSGGCHCCEHMVSAKSKFRSSVTGRTHSVQAHTNTITCSSRDLIYLATCNKCRFQYVGQTTTPLRERIHKHKATVNTIQTRGIRAGDERIFAQHFASKGKGCCTWKDVRFAPI